MTWLTQFGHVTYAGVDPVSPRLFDVRVEKNVSCLSSPTVQSRGERSKSKKTLFLQSDKVSVSEKYRDPVPGLSNDVCRAALMLARGTRNLDYL